MAIPNLDLSNAPLNLHHCVPSLEGELHLLSEVTLLIHIYVINLPFIIQLAAIIFIINCTRVKVATESHLFRHAVHRYVYTSGSHHHILIAPTLLTLH